MAFTYQDTVVDSLEVAVKISTCRSQSMAERTCLDVALVSQDELLAAPDLAFARFGRLAGARGKLFVHRDGLRRYQHCGHV